jgi:hypothetical protein
MWIQIYFAQFSEDKKMFETLYNTLRAKKDKWINEEELRQGWVFALQQELGVDFHAERGKKDFSYNNVVIEFKGKGFFKGKKSSSSFKEAIQKRLLPYILQTAKQEYRDPSDYIGMPLMVNIYVLPK